MEGNLVWKLAIPNIIFTKSIDSEHFSAYILCTHRHKQWNLFIGVYLPRIWSWLACHLGLKEAHWDICHNIFFLAWLAFSLLDTCSCNSLSSGKGTFKFKSIKAWICKRIARINSINSKSRINLEGQETTMWLYKHQLWFSPIIKTPKFLKEIPTWKIHHFHSLHCKCETVNIIVFSRGSVPAVL